MEHIKIGSTMLPKAKSLWAHNRITPETRKQPQAMLAVAFHIKAYCL